MGHLLAGHLMGAHLDSIRPDGHLEGTHLQDEHLFPAVPTVFESDPLVFGRFRFGVVIEDAVGNATVEGVEVREHVVNSYPPAAHDLLPTEHDAESDRLSFSFTASEKLIG
jgi:hypothetical protein